MTSPHDRSQDPHAGPGVVLVRESCDHVWEPSLAERAERPVPCTQCGGWTMTAELAEGFLPAARVDKPLETRGDHGGVVQQFP